MTKLAKGLDTLTVNERSAHMSRIRPKGARSTEERVTEVFEREGILGWCRNTTLIFGKPDFFFSELKLAVFVDGCFWHGCPICDRNIPATRTAFWLDKIETNRERDRCVTRVLRSQGFHVLRLWEHELSNEKWLTRFSRMATRINNIIKASMSGGSDVVE